MSTAGFLLRTKHFVTRQNKRTVKVNNPTLSPQHAFGCLNISIIHVIIIQLSALSHSACESKNGCVKNIELVSFISWMS